MSPCHTPAFSSVSCDSVLSSRHHVLPTPTSIRRPNPCSTKQLRHCTKILAVLSKEPSPPTSRKNFTPPPASSAAPPSTTPSTSPSPSTSSPPLHHLSSPTPPLADPHLAHKLNHLLRTIIPNDQLFHSPPETPSTRTQAQASTTSPVYTTQTPRTPGPGPSAGNAECYYFAYGTNLHKDSLFSNDVTVLSRDAAVVCDPNVHLVFRHKGGQATLMRLLDQEQTMFTPPGSCVHGVLYRIHEQQLRKLKQLDWGYELMEVEVQTYAGQTVRSWVFVSSRMALLPREVQPAESYMRQLRDGAADQFLDPTYQAWLSSIETVSSAGLPMDYFNTPAKYALYMAVALGTAAAIAGFLSQM